MGNAKESSAEVKQYYCWELVRIGMAVGAWLLWFFGGSRQIGVYGSGGRVAYSRAGVNIDDVVEALTSADEPVLLGIGPFGDGLGNGVDGCGDGLIVGVFKTERPGVLCYSFDTVNRVVVSCAFPEKDSKGVIETCWGGDPIHHHSHCFVQGGRTSGASGFPGSVGDAVHYGGTRFSMFEEVFDMDLSGEVAFFE